jgi:hypothetical protein
MLRGVKVKKGNLCPSILVQEYAFACIQVSIFALREVRVFHVLHSYVEVFEESLDEKIACCLHGVLLW